MILDMFHKTLRRNNLRQITPKLTANDVRRRTLGPSSPVKPSQASRPGRAPNAPARPECLRGSRPARKSFQSLSEFGVELWSRQARRSYRLGFCALLCLFVAMGSGFEMSVRRLSLRPSRKLLLAIYRSSEFGFRPSDFGFQGHVHVKLCKPKISVPAMNQD